MFTNITETKHHPVLAMTYSHDGFGLGHLRRNTMIAARFAREMPGSSVLMMVGCPSGAFFDLPPGVDYIKIPSIIKVDTGQWHPRTLNISSENIKAIRTFTIQKAAELFKPDLFLVDYTPTGVYGELLPTLQMLKERKNPPRIILGLRDILDTPEVSRDLWEKENAYEAVRQYYDRVLIYGCQDTFDTASQYSLNEKFPEKITYCGYLCPEDEYKNKKVMRKELQIKKEKVVVVTAGAGYDAYPMMRTCMEAFQLLCKDYPVEAIFITGSLMEYEERQLLHKWAMDLPVRVLKSVEDHLSYINAADLLITMAGYNTLMDVIRLQKRILIIPRQGPSAEQKMRAQLFSDLGLGQLIHPDELTKTTLARVILENLDSDLVPLIPFKTDGLKSAVRHLIHELEMDAIPLTTKAVY
jgi:predicted glycosyltransferase